MKNKLNYLIIGGSVVLIVIAVVFIVLIIKNIEQPIKFNDLSDARFKSTIVRLKDIREAQKLYKEANGHYTPSFDSLINFIEKDQLKVVKKIGNVPDSLTEKKAIELGIVSRDTLLVPVKDSLLNIRVQLKYIPQDKPKNYLLENINELAYIPVGKKTPFVMDTATILTGSGVFVKSFQCYSLYDDILDGLDKQLIVNLKATKHEDIYAIKKIHAKDSLGKDIMQDTVYVFLKGKVLDTTYYKVKDNSLSDDVISKEDLKNYNTTEYGYRTSPKKYEASLRVGHLKEANNLAGNWGE